MLKLEGVDAFYGDLQALFSVSLEVRLGEAVAVIGPNGAGKTTLMRLISGLIRPMRGRVSFDSVDLLSTPAHHMQGPPGIPMKTWPPMTGRHVSPVGSMVSPMSTSGMACCQANSWSAFRVARVSTQPTMTSQVANTSSEVFTKNASFLKR